jgi:hypothetical protein
LTQLSGAQAIAAGWNKENVKQVFGFCYKDVNFLKILS